jgi:hypothetical protein
MTMGPKPPAPALPHGRHARDTRPPVAAPSPAPRHEPVTAAG